MIYKNVYNVYTIQYYIFSYIFVEKNKNFKIIY